MSRSSRWSATETRSLSQKPTATPRSRWSSAVPSTTWGGAGMVLGDGKGSSTTWGWDWDGSGVGGGIGIGREEVRGEPSPETLRVNPWAIQPHHESGAGIQVPASAVLLWPKVEEQAAA